MNMGESLFQVQFLINQFILNNGIEPNQVILGIEVSNDIQSDIFTSTGVVMRDGEVSTLMGLDVVIDYNQPKEIKVGYVISGIEEDYHDLE